MLTFIQSLIQIVVDFLFTPSKEELEIRYLSTEEFLEIAPKASMPEFPFIKSLFSYRNSLIRELIWQIKYKKNRHATKCAAYALYSELNKINSSPIILIPIPISDKRRKERGYNQCELIVEEIIKLDTEKKFIKNYNLLFRIKDIERQTLKNKAERIKNTKNIFKTRVQPIKYNLHNNQQEKIIIIDDVSTTGSTLKEARETLIQAGYNNIETMTIAH